MGSLLAFCSYSDALQSFCVLTIRGRQCRVHLPLLLSVGLAAHSTPAANPFHHYLPPRRRFTLQPGRHPMPATTMHWCPSCREWFTPDRYNAWHQHYCSKPSCRVASHCASSAD